MADSGIEHTGAPDAVIGVVPPSRDGQAVENTIARILQSALPKSTPPLKLALVHPPYTPSRNEAPDLTIQWQRIENGQLAQDPSALAQSLGDSSRTIFETTQKLGARACAVVASDLSSATTDWTSLLLRPVLQDHFDLVAPCYVRHPFEGMINRGIVYPFVRALYGLRIRNPVGPDFGISSRFLQRIQALPRARPHTLLSLAAEGVTNGMKICQTHLGPRIYALPDLTNLSSLLAQILGSLFLDVERYAAYWQRARGSQPIPEFGEPISMPVSENPVDTSRLIESFQLGARNLQEVWSIILPPSTLVEFRKLARNSDATFRMPDVTWARVIYDFALAHRLRSISRDQMLRALTPIYLGWCASYALEMENSGPEVVEQRLEKLCLVFEDTKSYFVSRWRWPDRFNP